MIEYQRYSDEELISLRNKTINLVIFNKGRRDGFVAILWFYGVFAFVGMLMWALEKALEDYVWWGRIINYAIILSGGIALYYAQKLSSDRKEEMKFLEKQLLSIDTEIKKRSS